MCMDMLQVACFMDMQGVSASGLPAVVVLQTFPADVGTCCCCLPPSCCNISGVSLAAVLRHSGLITTCVWGGALPAFPRHVPEHSQQQQCLLLGVCWVFDAWVFVWWGLGLLWYWVGLMAPPVQSGLGVSELVAHSSLAPF